ncbi:MAG: lipopolysaccharide biosynthesis protein [Bacteroidales bacterium]|nr:lipopolysaccharide biosynthesis protein [Candidatus Equimonas faecalis]
MQDNQSKNKRLAKNTMSMYVRMLFLMLISFYTSRVVLQALGAEDFGTYNVVGGVVVMFTFINAAMTTGTQRHLSFELGLPDGNVGRIFSACFNIHLWLALLIVILSETIGLWFLNAKLNFPEGRMTAVNWVYQLSILACVLNIIRVPYNAAIIAYEKMSFYAYIGIIEGILKLAIVFMLAYSPCDKLVYYAILMMLVIAIVTFAYYFYCRKNFSEIRYSKVSDKALYKRLLNFSGWTLFGSVANMARNQGVTFIVNIFYGVTANAAIGIANQVNAGITQFVTGFQQAFNPQLTKAEAAKDREYQTKLINMTAKYSYLVILFCSVPILYNLDYLLTFWLGEYLAYTREFCLWIVIATLIDSISGPLWVTIFATGKIKSYQIYISLLLLLILPLGYACGAFGLEPQYIFAIQSLLNFLAIIVRLYMMRGLLQFSMTRFAKSVFFPICVVTILMFPIIYLRSSYQTLATEFSRLVLQSIIIVIYELIIIILVGLKQSERRTILNLIKSRVLK